jgi:26S proteasome non-ATPase regulatory subunit 9
MTESLVDLQGFPRTDIDVLGVRTARHHILRLSNDHKALMAQMSDLLTRIHVQAAQEGLLPTPSSSTASDVLVPFALVDGVAPESPAAESGLQRDDKILKVGRVTHKTSSQPLQALSQLISQSEGASLPVTVERPGHNGPLELTLRPRKWDGGKGLLGCHILPL